MKGSFPPSGKDCGWIRAGPAGSRGPRSEAGRGTHVCLPVQLAGRTHTHTRVSKEDPKLLCITKVLVWQKVLLNNSAHALRTV